MPQISALSRELIFYKSRLDGLVRSRDIIGRCWWVCGRGTMPPVSKRIGWQVGWWVFLCSCRLITHVTCSCFGRVLIIWISHFFYRCNCMIFACISCNSYLVMFISYHAVTGKSLSTLRIEMTAWFIIQFLGSTSGSPVINQWVPNQSVGPFPNDVANYWIKGKGGCFPLNPLPTCDLIYHWQATFKGNYLLVYTPDRVFRMCVRNFDLPLIQLLQHGSFPFKVDSPQFSLSHARGDVGSNSNGQWHSAERHKEQGSITALVVSNGSSGAKVQEQVDIQMVLFLYHLISLLCGRSLAALNWSKAWSSLSKSWYSVAVLQDVTSTWFMSCKYERCIWCEALFIKTSMSLARV